MASISPPASGASPTASRRGRAAIGWAAVMLVLALVFSAYLNPHLVVDLASRVWSCF